MLIRFVSLMDENDWNQVLRNCSLLYGWKVDKKTNTITRATTPAFKLRSNIPDPTPLPELEEESETTKEAPSVPVQAAPQPEEPTKQGTKTPPSTVSETEYETDEDSAIDVSYESSPELSAPDEEEKKALTADDLRAVKPSKPGVLPSFVITDNSKIDVSVVTHAFQKSMAENHFSSTSVEASV